MKQQKIQKASMLFCKLLESGNIIFSTLIFSLLSLLAHAQKNKERRFRTIIICIILTFFSSKEINMKEEVNNCSWLSKEDLIWQAEATTNTGSLAIFLP